MFFDRIRPRRALAILGFAALPLMAAGCSTNPATGERSFTGFMPPEQEKKVGAEQHPQVVKQFGGQIDDQELAAYVDRIGQKLAAQSEMPDLDWTFTVLDDEGVNALALPGGYIYVMRGLLALAENEAELAGVLGHEIGHVTARHSAQRYSRSVATGLGAAILGAVIDVPGVGQLAQTGSQLYLASFSREQELQADRLGVRYLRRAGYDVTAMSSFLSKMERYADLKQREAGNEGGETPNFLATHPRTEARVQEAIAAAEGEQPASALVNESPYLKQIDGLIWGTDPDEGFVRGQSFIHPALRFRFQVPEGFRVINTPSKVIAVSQQGPQIQFDAARSQASPSAYLQREWGGTLNLQGVEQIDVNGMPAATGATRVNTQQAGPLDLRLVAIRFDQNAIYRFAFLSPPQMTEGLSEAFRRTTYSFEKLSEQQAQAYQPRRIQLVLAEAGDTVPGLASRMAVDRFKEEWFRTLNGLEANGSLQQGRLYKIVAE